MIKTQVLVQIVTVCMTIRDHLYILHFIVLSVASRPFTYKEYVAACPQFHQEAMSKIRQSWRIIGFHVPPHSDFGLLVKASKCEHQVQEEILNLFD